MTKPLSIIFLGTSDFAVPSLRALAADKRFEVTLVITQPDRPVGRKQVLTPPPVKLVAEELGLPVRQPESMNTEIENGKLKMENCDFLVVISYGQILSEKILKFPAKMPINLHASLLPELRGASPLQHAILQDHKQTGLTVQRMVKELDAGPILSQQAVEIEADETFTSLHDRLALLGADLLIKTLTSPLKETEQDASKATFCKKLSRETGKVDPSTHDAATIERMVRALSPWPGVAWGDKKILEASLSNQVDAFELVCMNNSKLYITKIQPAGKKPMTGSEFKRGHSA